MNILFGNFSEHSTSTTSDILSEKLNKDNDQIDHYIEFKIILLNKRCVKFFNKKILNFIYRHNCNNILVNHQTNNLIHMILKFNTVVDLFSFGQDIVPFVSYMSFRHLTKTLTDNIININTSDLSSPKLSTPQTPETPMTPQNSSISNMSSDDECETDSSLLSDNSTHRIKNKDHDEDHDDEDHDDEDYDEDDDDQDDDDQDDDQDDEDHDDQDDEDDDDQDDDDEDEDDEDDEDYVKSDKVYENIVKMFTTSNERDNTISLILDKSMIINHIENYQHDEYKSTILNIVQQYKKNTPTILQHNSMILSTCFSKLKEDYQLYKKYSSRIIKVSIPKVKTYTTMQCLSPYYGFVRTPPDSEYDSDSDSDFDTSEYNNDTWELQNTNTTNTILRWIGYKNNADNTYLLTIDKQPILYFSDRNKIELYMKNISLMIMRKFEEKDPISSFKMEKTDKGYRISKCIFNILIKLYINYCNIEMHTIFKICK